MDAYSSQELWEDPKMECFVHENSPAIALCKACGKGVCRTCAIEVEHGIACSERCRPVVSALTALQDASIRNVGLATAHRFAQPLFAVVFIAMGLWFLHEGAGAFAWFLIGLGSILGVALLMTRLRSRTNARPR